MPDDKCRGEIELNPYYVDYVYHYWEAKHTQGVEAQMQLYTPICTEWGVIPLTPKTVEVEFKQAYQGKIELEEGWNFFSVPRELDPSNDQWAQLLSPLL